MAGQIGIARINALKKVTFWYTFFIVFPVIVLFQNISFYIFLLLVVAMYQVSGNFFSLKRAHQWFAILFVLGAGLSIMYMPFEVASRNGMERSLDVFFNYGYWAFLVIFLVVNRQYIDVHAVLKGVFFGLIFLTLYYFFFRRILLFIPVFHNVTQNTYAFIAIAYTPPAVYYVLHRWGRRPALGFAFVLTVINFLGGSRSGSLLVLAGATLIFVITHTTMLRITLYGIAGYFIALYALNIGFVKNTIQKLNVRTYELVYNTEETLRTDRSYLVRQAMIAKGLALFERYPYTGIGLNNFTNYELKVKGKFEGAEFVNRKNIFEDRSAHNSYIGLLAEGGLFVFIPFVLLVGSSLVYFVLRFNHVANEHRPFFIGLLCMCVHLYFIMAIVNIYAWFLIAITSALVYRKNMP